VQFLLLLETEKEEMNNSSKLVFFKLLFVDHYLNEQSTSVSDYSFLLEQKLKGSKLEKKRNIKMIQTFESLRL
jgi:hypothetical protein